jgi:hypothetical protein
VLDHCSIKTRRRAVVGRRNEDPTKQSIRARELPTLIEHYLLQADRSRGVDWALFAASPTGVAESVAAGLE